MRVLRLTWSGYHAALRTRILEAPALSVQHSARSRAFGEYNFRSPMTPTQVLDALCGKHVSRINFDDGSWVEVPAGASMFVDFCDADVNTDGCIEVCDDGLVLHFNAILRGPRGDGGMRGQHEPFGNIAHVVESAYHRLLDDLRTFLDEINGTSANEMLARQAEGERLIQRFDRYRAMNPVADDDELVRMRNEMPW